VFYEGIVPNCSTKLHICVYLRSAGGECGLCPMQSFKQHLELLVQLLSICLTNKLAFLRVQGTSGSGASDSKCQGCLAC
jgi:hypothetical protein